MCPPQKKTEHKTIIVKCMIKITINEIHHKCTKTSTDLQLSIVSTCCHDHAHQYVQLVTEQMFLLSFKSLKAVSWGWKLVKQN